MILKRLLLLLGLITPVLAQEVEKFRSLPGVAIGKVTYRLSESKRDLRLETFLAVNEEVPSGQEVRYLYNRLSLDGKHKHVLVFLMGSYFAGSGGGTGLILEDVPEAPLGFRYLGTFTLVNTPILVSPAGNKGWNELTWLIRGGGVEPSYATVTFDGNRYNQHPLRKGEQLKGQAYLADVITPESGLRFTAR